MKNRVVVLLLLMMLVLVGCVKTTDTTMQTSSTTATANISSTTMTSVNTAVPTVGPSVNAPVSINENSDEQTVTVNLVKFTGSIPSPDATVLVNNNVAPVDNSGNYYIYLDLQKGQNVIEVKTINGTEINIKDINIFFAPPLTIRLENLALDPTTDLKMPTPISGIVSNPAAQVEINGLKVNVNSDGTFTTQIQSVVGENHADVTAQLGKEADEEEWYWKLADNGQMIFVSGFLTSPVMLPTVTLNAGESTDFNFYLQFNKTVPDASMNLISITRIAGPNGQNNTLPMLPELQVMVEPSTYTTYPRIIYDSQITILTSTALPPGDYYFYVDSPLGQGALFQQSGYETSYILKQGSNSSEGAEFEVIIN
jgi:hypothetical protein